MILLLQMIRRMSGRICDNLSLAVLHRGEKYKASKETGWPQVKFVCAFNFLCSDNQISAPSFVDLSSSQPCWQNAVSPSHATLCDMPHWPTLIFKWYILAGFKK